MRRARKIAPLVAVIGVYAAVFGQSNDFPVPGKVVELVNGQPQPVVMATVTFAATARRLSWDFSRTDGSFGPGIGTSTMRPLKNNVIALHGPVSIDIFNADGKKVGSVSNDNITQGMSMLKPVAARLPAAVYLLKIKAGNQVVYRKMLSVDAVVLPMENNQALSSDNTIAIVRTAAAGAIVDSIRIGKTGYLPVWVPISDTFTSVGTVTLVKDTIDGKVNALFARMTTSTQKIGQLCMPQWTPAGGGSALASANAGSIFGGGGALVGSSVTACANAIDGYQTSMMTGTFKIPLMAAFDFVHGASACPGATFFPHNLALGAIQDTFLIQKAFRVAALEVRGSGCNWGYGPCIAVIRDDRWGRAYEGFCETPERTQIMARHAVLGCQLTDLTNPMTYAACVKHFAGDGNTTNGVNAGTTVGPDSTARAINLPGYASAVAAGAATIMPSFSNWCDGTGMHVNKTLMTGWLKSTATGNPGFKGFIVSDWNATQVPNSIDAGVDVPMVSSTGTGEIGTINAQYSGYQARIDDAVKRVLRVKCWMNLTDPKQYMTDKRLTALVGCAAHRDVARACVRASLVLLKNANATLPMPKNANVAIWGTAGNDVGIQCGGWTVSWQGQTGAIPGGGGTAIYGGMQTVGTGGTINYVASPTGAGSSTYVVAVFSENPYAETSFPNVALTGNDASSTNAAVITQIAAAHAAGKKVIGILIAGRALDISGVIGNCDAFIWACLPGSEGGLGIAQMLYGDQGYKFSGKLPISWPNNSTNEPINLGDGQTPLFAYGFGLSD